MKKILLAMRLQKIVLSKFICLIGAENFRNIIKGVWNTYTCRKWDWFETIEKLITIANDWPFFSIIKRNHLSNESGNHVDKNPFPTFFGLFLNHYLFYRYSPLHMKQMDALISNITRNSKTCVKKLFFVPGYFFLCSASAFLAIEKYSSFRILSKFFHICPNLKQKKRFKNKKK